jgi:hypothetical protein
MVANIITVSQNRKKFSKYLMCGYAKFTLTNG